jgi:hypothetical protein
MPSDCCARTAIEETPVVDPKLDPPTDGDCAKLLTSFERVARLDNAGGLT